jgi:hypothetical protein
MPINWGLISNPANWLVVFLMLAIASIGITAVYASWTTNQEN